MNFVPQFSQITTRRNLKQFARHVFMKNFFISICLIFMPSFSRRLLALMETSGSIRRLRMKDWLYNLLEKGDTRGLCWEDRDRLIFRIEWKHGSRHGYSFEKDAIVFREWAEYTGKLKRNYGPDPKRWKANFRCALNSLKNIKKIDTKKDRGADAFRRYQFVTCSGNNNKNNMESRKIKMEPGQAKRQKTSLPLPFYQEVKIKEEKQDCSVDNETESAPSGSLGNSFCYPLDARPREPHFNWMTPPHSPEAKVLLLLGTASPKAEPSVPLCNSCDVTVWGSAHAHFCKDRNTPLTPPLTPPDLVLPDLDIENLSGAQAFGYSATILDVYDDDMFDDM